MEAALSLLAALISLGGYIPYAIDILKGKVKPARAARIMFALLLTITILQQHDIGSGWLIAVTAGELVGSFAILLLAFKRGMGGLSRSDMACYLMLLIDIIIWKSTGNTLLALHLTVLADLIAFTPTLLKTWRQPWTETPLFFITGVVAPFLNILAVGSYSYAILLFPLYLGLINLLEVILIVYRQKRVPEPALSLAKDSQPLN